MSCVTITRPKDSGDYQQLLVGLAPVTLFGGRSNIHTTQAQLQDDRAGDMHVGIKRRGHAGSSRRKF